MPQPGSMNERALAAGPVLWAWLLAVGVDLLYNAGFFAPLFDQVREPGLLPDATLVQRIPIAYLVVAVGVAIVAWLIDETDNAGAGRGAVVGAATGVIFGLTGAVWLWTAIDMTLLFVLAAIVVQVSQMAAAGAVLGAVRAGVPRRVVRGRALGSALAAGIVAIVVQNVLG
jgi:hypothetical protein